MRAIYGLHLFGRLLLAKRGHLPEEVLAGGALSFHDAGVRAGDLLPGGRGLAAQRRLGHLKQHIAVIGDRLGKNKMNQDTRI